MTLPIISQYGLDAVIETYARKGTVNYGLLAYLDFATTPQPVWTGEFDIPAGGITWQALGRSGFVISVENLETASTLEAATFNVMLSGVDSSIIAAAADSDRAEYINRALGLYVLFCDGDWQPLANPFAIIAGFMGAMTIARNLNEGIWQRNINLPVNNMFFGRGVVPWSNWSDRDQQLRYPGDGDTGLQFILQLQDYMIRQPWA